MTRNNSRYKTLRQILDESLALLSEYENIACEMSEESFVRQREIFRSMEKLCGEALKIYASQRTESQAETVAMIYQAWNSFGEHGTFPGADRFILEESSRLLSEADIPLPEKVVLTSILHGDDNRYNRFFSESAKQLASSIARESDRGMRSRLQTALRALPAFFPVPPFPLHPAL